jgi:hypothetical protein
MATIILLQQEDLTRNSILGGNIDTDRYLQDIKSCQNLYIKPLLGDVLYTKICADYKAGSLAGLYLTLYEDYVKELVIHGSAEIYLTHGAYMVSNNGITKLKSDSAETISKEEMDYLSQSSSKLYNLYKNEFYKWIEDKNLPEYPETVKNKTKYIKAGGWFLRKPTCQCKINGYYGECNCG